MELIVLGSAGTWPSAGRATSGFLVQHDGFTIWMDAGSGTLARLQMHMALEDVGAVLISHGHPDHFVDVYPFFYARHYGRMGTPGLPMYVPPGFMDLVGGLISEDGHQTMRRSFDVRELQPGTTFGVGPFRIEARRMAHIGVEAYGYRIEADGAALAYSGDTGPTEELIALARGADVLVAEATWQDHCDLLPFHLSARQAGEHAKAAGAGRLVLTHIWPTFDPEVSRAQAAEAFDGPIDVAHEGMRLEIGG